MKVGEVRKMMEELDLTEEIQARANELLANLREDEEIEEKIKGEVVALIKLEMKVAEIQAETWEKAADSIDQYLVEVDRSIDVANHQMDDLEETGRAKAKKPL